MHEGRHMLPEPVLGTTLADSSSADSFCKDGRKISVGDCALFRAGNSPPFIGIIRWLSTSKENNYLKLGVNWLYRPADVKISKGILPKASPNEVFYSFHKDEISAASLLHPCKVAFLHKSVELPSGISSFVCRRVYDIANKCLWWLTDHDYINERQKEVDQLLDKTRLEMHAAVQSGGRSPKPLNSPTSTAPLKSGSDNVENSSSSFSSQGSKNKNKERGNQGSDSIKQERSSKLDDGDSVHFRQESMIKAELANVIDKGGLINIEGVEKLVHFMQRDRAEKKIDLLGRVMLANLIAATERLDCLGHFVQLRGVSVLDDWLQEAHKGKIGEGSSPKESDKSVEELVVTLLRALDKLPVNLLALQTCNVGKSVNNLRSHKNLEIQRKARSLVDTWKKRVDAEMKMNDAKIGMIQTVPWPGKAGFPEASHGGNRRPGPSAEAAGKCSSMQPSASKTTSVKFSHGDTVLKQTSSPVPVKLTSSLPSSVTINSKGSDVQLASTKEEKSSSSSQSHNSQSCSSEHPKTVGSTWKEDPRSSTAGSISTNKRSSTGTSRSRRSSNGFIGSGFSVVKKEISNGKSGITNRNAQPDKVSQSEVTCERMLDMPVPDHANSHRLIVRLPNPGRSPARGATGGSFEDPSVTGRRASSPGIFEKHDPSDKKTKGKIECHQAGNNADMNTESWPRSDVKDEVAGSDEGERSPVAPPDEERGKITEELVKPMELSKSVCSWRGGKKELLVAEHKTSKSHGSSFSPMNALIESCVKFSEAASASSSFRDDLGMNLLASVATGEMCNSETFLPIGSPRRNSPAVIGDKNKAMAGVSNANEIADNVPEKQDNDASPLHVNDESQQTSLRPVANNGSNNNNATGNSKNNLSSVQNKLAVTQNEQILASRIDLKSNVKPDEPSDNGCEAMSTCMEVDDTLTDVTKQGSEGEEAHLQEKKKASTSGNNSEEVIDSKTEGRTASLHGNKMVDNAPETTVETTQDGVAYDSVGGLMGEGSDVERAASCTEVEKKVVEESKPCPSILTGINIKLRDEVLIHHQPLPTVAANCLEALDRNEDFFALPISGIIKEPSKPENNEGMEVTSNSKPIDKEKPEKSALGSKALDDRVGAGDMFEENSSEKKVFKREQSPSELVQEHEPGVVSTGFMLSAVNADEMEDRVAAAAVSSTAVGSDTSGKLDFDLNEGFASAEGNNQGDTATSSAPGSSSVPKLPNMLPFSLSTMSTTVPPTSITVAAAAKGPFVPPENLLRSRGELGWKGSAATSAFRPAEPRKVLELLLNATDVSITDTDNMSSKQGRPPLEIDLNMPDERDPEDTVSMRSVPKVGSELVPASNHASLQITGGLNLDLNRLDEGTENGQFSASTSQRLELSHLPLKLSSPSSRFLNGQVNVLRDFDLNDGPVPEEAGAVEPAQSNQYRSKSNLQSMPPMPGLRVNNIELGSLSSWFPPGSCSYPAVSVPSFLTDRAGDPPYPIVGSSGAHQRLLGSAINGTFGGDLYRGPILSSTMPFNPTTAASFPYAGIPLGTSFPLASTSFSAGPTYMDTSSGGAGGPCFPAVPSQLVGPAVAVSSHYPRPYAIGLPEGSTSSGIAESNRKWGRHVLDLNAGPGSADVEGRDERFPSRQFSVASSQTSAEEQQARMYHAVKRKEPDGGWDAERFGYKQPSWH